ncbi:hypothetical protein NQ176_g1752 [Zarea fungicola]|uniref:Uncharacterized protein n=1 Tax=Zarea fungicola TaxID=93591 RepID=A0ACC1NSH8_9HYPO|nr:hypothetical protein NQ176_g1752 [Lecanicillium fungicola]
MKVSTVFLLAGSLGAVLGHQEFDKIYATVSDVDLGHGTVVHKGVKYALPKSPGRDWYISNANGTEIPHHWYLPNMKAGDPVAVGKGVAAAKVGTESSTTSKAGVALEARQLPPLYVNYYNLPYCDDFDAQNRPPTLNQCVWNRSLVAWGSSYVPPGTTCRFIVNYYNSGCGFQTKCGGYIDQTFDFVGCFAPSRVFCSTFARCCISGC